MIANNINSLNAYSIYSDYKFYDDFLYPKNTKNGAYSATSSFWGVNQAIGTGTGMYAAMTALKTNATSFKNSTSALTSPFKNGVFNLKSAVSSNTDALTAKIDNKAFASPKPMEINVNQIALAQKNEGAALSATEKTIAAGAYAFAVKVGSKTTSISIAVTAQDTNQSVMAKIADSVNAKNLGVKASVVKNTGDNTSKLVFEAAATGTKDGNDVFTLTDTGAPDAGSGLIALTGTGAATQQAQNALYTLNGSQKSSMSNDIDLGGISITIKQATSSAVKIDFKQDTAAVAKGVEDFAKSYNTLMATGLENGLGKMVSALTSAGNTYKTSLSKVGISLDGGKMSIDSAKLNKAIDDGSLERIFNTRSNYGFGSRIQSAADSIASNPMRYSNMDAQLSLYTLQSSMSSYYNMMFSGQLFNFMI